MLTINTIDLFQEYQIYHIDFKELPEYSVCFSLMKKLNVTFQKTNLVQVMHKNKLGNARGGSITEDQLPEIIRKCLSNPFFEIDLRKIIFNDNFIVKTIYPDLT